MKYLIFITKLLLDALRDTFKIVNYFKLRKFNNFSVVIKLFLIRFFYAIPFIRNLKKVKIKNLQSKELCFNSSKINLNKILKSLIIKGYSETYKLEEKLLNNIKTEILNNNLNISSKKNPKGVDLAKQNFENESDYIKRLSSNEISRVVGVLNLKKTKFLKKFILSKDLIELVSLYLNSNILSINTSYFISLPIITSKTEKYKNAQFFHWDNDFTKFLKLYVYLSDVDDFSGPHIFVEGTHVKKKLEHCLPRLYSDDKIYDSYKNIKLFNGKKGSFFLTDSYGIHKGMPPKKNYRIMLNIHFGNNDIKYHEDDTILKI